MQSRVASYNRKTVFVLVDGIGDVTLSCIGYKTPLEYANTRNLDNLARHGVCGLMDPVEVGLTCGSDTAHLSIFGYNPRACYRGRGAFETMGSGLEMNIGDIAFKSNFAVLDPLTGIVVSRRADREFGSWGKELCDHLNNIRLPNFPEYKATFQYATEHRCGVRIEGPGLSDEISDTDPLKDNLPLRKSMPLSDDQHAKQTAALVNELSWTVHTALEKHPMTIERKKRGLAYTNVVLFRGCGRRLQVPSFYDKHQMKAFVIAPTKIIAGLALTLRMELVHVQGATGDYTTNMMAKARACVKWMNKAEDYDFGFIHIKAVDDTGHDGLLDRKIGFLEQIDDMVGYLIEHLSSSELKRRVNLVVTGDHSTPVRLKDHSFHPVPFVLCPLPFGTLPRIWQQRTVKVYSETAAGFGVLGRFTGDQVMPIVKYFAEQSPLSESG
eukprot:jgi/Galph1/3735/GphlegSOOS_G2378.1